MEVPSAAQTPGGGSCGLSRHRGSGSRHRGELLPIPEPNTVGLPAAEREPLADAGGHPDAQRLGDPIADAFGVHRAACHEQAAYDSSADHDGVVGAVKPQPKLTRPRHPLGPRQSPPRKAPRRYRSYRWKLGRLALWANQFENHTIVGMGWLGPHGWEFEFAG